MTNGEKNFGAVIAETTMRAVAELLKTQGKTSDDCDLDVLIPAIRVEAKQALTRILDQGRVLADSGMSGWSEVLVKTECFTAAQKALKVVL